MMAPVLFTFLALFFPGVLLFFRGNILPAYSTGEKLILTIPVSLAYWIIGFWWLSIFPLPFTLWVYLSVGAAALILEIDKETGKTIIKVVDATTNEVIRQIPGDDIVAIAKAIDRMRGLLLHQQA